MKDGVIVGKNSEPVKVSTYLTTKRKFRDFKLNSKVKLVDGGPRNGGSLAAATDPRSAGLPAVR